MAFHNTSAPSSAVISKDTPPNISPDVSQSHSPSSPCNLATSTDISLDTLLMPPPHTRRMKKQKFSILPKDATFKIHATYNDDGTITLIATGHNIDFHQLMHFKSKQIFEKAWNRIRDRKLRILSVPPRAENQFEGDDDKELEKEKRSDWSGTDLRRYVLLKRKREMGAKFEREKKAGGV